ncbi:MAG TPA: tetratricopeptide repeat protein, partial [Tepidisphaeraceae bacterium]
NLSLLLINHGQLDEATRTAQKAIELDPNDSAAHANLGVALAQNNHLEPAIAEFQRALQLDPENRTVRHDLATAVRKVSPSTTVP